MTEEFISKIKLKKWVIVLLLTLFTWISLLTLSDIILKYRVPVALPYGKSFFFNDSFVSARGTWTIEGQEQGFPLQTDEIKCFKTLNKCFSAQANIGFGDQMIATLEDYEILEWDQNHLTYLNDAPKCVLYIYTINRLTESVSAIRKLRNQNPKDLGICDGLEKELHLSLSDGFKVQMELEKKRAPWIQDIALLPFKIFN